jgi:hypothetical protein
MPRRSLDLRRHHTGRYSRYNPTHWQEKSQIREFSVNATDNLHYTKSRASTIAGRPSTAKIPEEHKWSMREEGGFVAGTHSDCRRCAGAGCRLSMIQLPWFGESLLTPQEPSLAHGVKTWIFSDVFPEQTPPEQTSMATAKQIDANRRNAQKSTGPKTEEGRDRVRRNALKHGMTARTVLPQEDPRLQDERIDLYTGDLQPRNALELDVSSSQRGYPLRREGAPKSAKQSQFGIDARHRATRISIRNGRDGGAKTKPIFQGGGEERTDIARGLTDSSDERGADSPLE